MYSVQELDREAQDFFTKVQIRAERCDREMASLIQTQKRELNALQRMSSFRSKPDSLLPLPDQRDASWQRVQLLESHVKDSSQSTNPRLYFARNASSLEKEDLQMEHQFLEAEKSRKEGEQASLQRQLDAINEEVHETQHAYETNQRSDVQFVNFTNSFPGLEERRRVLESRQSKLLETLNKYSSVLGLKFERSGQFFSLFLDSSVLLGNTMEFTFVNICEWDPKREFKVLLALDGNQNYQG